ncbi:PTS system mannose/fructose/sorbose family transporter subunit IID, partial [[Clostridium] innocuum]|nr:PTS system mannose/fructose/sorbose family transporter subunit IID [[Clostridium] innocuum]
STTVKVNVPLVFASGEGKIVVQELIDKIMPCFLPVLVTVFCYWRLKKTNGKEAVLLIFGIMIVSIGLTYLGILG